MIDPRIKIDLTKIVLDKIVELGDTPAREYFGVSTGTISAWKLARTKPSILAAQKVLDEISEAAPVAAVEAAQKVMDEIASPAPVVAEEVWEEPTQPTPVNVTGAVTLLMPMYENIEPLTFITLVRAMKLYGMEKISIIPICRTLIDEARNSLAQRFLKTNSEWCVFLDSDMLFPCGSGQILKKMGLDLPEPKASRNALTRIMSHPKEARIVGALYQNRRGNRRPAVELAYRSPSEEARMRGFFTGATKTDGLEDAGWVGFGMVRIHRSVFVDMQDAAKPGGLLAEIAPPVGRENDAFGYFGRTPQWRGEDISFCRRAQKIGISTKVDTGLILGHQGKQYNLT